MSAKLAASGIKETRDDVGHRRVTILELLYIHVVNDPSEYIETRDTHYWNNMKLRPGKLSDGKFINWIQ